jgi:hypothetical protein
MNNNTTFIADVIGINAILLLTSNSILRREKQ